MHANFYCVNYVSNNFTRYVTIFLKDFKHHKLISSHWNFVICSICVNWFLRKKQKLSFAFIYDPIKVLLCEIPGNKVLFIYLGKFPQKNLKNAYLKSSTIELLEVQWTTWVNFHVFQIKNKGTRQTLTSPLHDTSKKPENLGFSDVFRE